MQHEFIQARNYTAHTRKVPRVVKWIVIHAMQSAERPGTARAVALWFAGKTASPAPKASAHYNVDSTVIIQCVREVDVAWGVNGSNSSTIHVEHAGMSEQTAAAWADVYSTSMLKLSARLVAEIVARHGIPPVFCDAQRLKEGLPGITGHVHMRDAFGKTTHWDPGPNFPWGDYMAAVRREHASILRTETGGA